MGRSSRHKTKSYIEESRRPRGKGNKSQAKFSQKITKLCSCVASERSSSSGSESESEFGPTDIIHAGRFYPLPVPIYARPWVGSEQEPEEDAWTGDDIQDDEQRSEAEESDKENYRDIDPFSFLTRAEAPGSEDLSGAYRNDDGFPTGSECNQGEPFFITESQNGQELCLEDNTTSEFDLERELISQAEFYSLGCQVEDDCWLVDPYPKKSLHHVKDDVEGGSQHYSEEQLDSTEDDGTYSDEDRAEFNACLLGMEQGHVEFESLPLPGEAYPNPPFIFQCGELSPILEDSPTDTSADIFENDAIQTMKCNESLITVNEMVPENDPYSEPDERNECTYLHYGNEEMTFTSEITDRDFDDVTQPEVIIQDTGDVSDCTEGDDEPSEPGVEMISNKVGGAVALQPDMSKDEVSQAGLGHISDHLKPSTATAAVNQDKVVSDIIATGSRMVEEVKALISELLDLCGQTSGRAALPVTEHGDFSETTSSTNSAATQSNMDQDKGDDMRDGCGDQESDLVDDDDTEVDNESISSNEDRVSAALQEFDTITLCPSPRLEGEEAGDGPRPTVSLTDEVWPVKKLVVLDKDHESETNEEPSVRSGEFHFSKIVLADVADPVQEPSSVTEENYSRSTAQEENDIASKSVCTSVDVNHHSSTEADHPIGQMQQVSDFRLHMPDSNSTNPDTEEELTNATGEERIHTRRPDQVLHLVDKNTTELSTDHHKLSGSDTITTCPNGNEQAPLFGDDQGLLDNTDTLSGRQDCEVLNEINTESLARPSCPSRVDQGQNDFLQVPMRAPATNMEDTQAPPANREQAIHVDRFFPVANLLAVDLPLPQDEYDDDLLTPEFEPDDIVVASVSAMGDVTVPLDHQEGVAWVLPNMSDTPTVPSFHRHPRSDHTRFPIASPPAAKGDDLLNSLFDMCERKLDEELSQNASRATRRADGSGRQNTFEGNEPTAATESSIAAAVSSIAHSDRCDDLVDSKKYGTASPTGELESADELPNEFDNESSEESFEDTVSHFDEETKTSDVMNMNNNDVAQTNETEHQASKSNREESAPTDNHSSTILQGICNKLSDDASMVVLSLLIVIGFAIYSRIFGTQISETLAHWVWVCQLVIELFCEGFKK